MIEFIVMEAMKVMVVKYSEIQKLPLTYIVKTDSPALRTIFTKRKTKR